MLRRPDDMKQKPKVEEKPQDEPKVEVKNEVKEVLVLIEGARNKEQRARTGADVQGNSMDPEITCVNLET